MKDESEYPGSTIQSRGLCTGEMKTRVQAGWTGWRDAAETPHDGTEIEDAAEPEENHRRRFMEGGRRMLEMQLKQDDMIQISDFTYLL